MPQNQTVLITRPTCGINLGIARALTVNQRRSDRFALLRLNPAPANEPSAAARR